MKQCFYCTFFCGLFYIQNNTAVFWPSASLSIEEKKKLVRSSLCYKIPFQQMVLISGQMEQTDLLQSFCVSLSLEDNCLTERSLGMNSTGQREPTLIHKSSPKSVMVGNQLLNKGLTRQANRTPCSKSIPSESRL